ncbi:MAG: hypothetical protein AMXMBFR53_26280 [Gemmatimonadota bacterium]
MEVLRSLANRASAVLAAALLLTLVTGCGDGLAPAPDGALTRDETVALAASMGIEALAFAGTRRAATQGAAAPEGAVPAPEVVTVDFSLRRPCPLGGAVNTSGSIRVETDGGPPRTEVADVTTTDVHDRCVFLVAPTRISLTGDPEVKTTVHAASRDGQPWGAQTVTVVGAVLWETDDDRSGRCAIDIFVEANQDAGTSVVRGVFCDHTFNVTVTGG